MRSPFRVCPSCGSAAIRWLDDRYWNCPGCGFTYYHNVAAAVGVFVVRDGSVLLLWRAMEPAAGKLALPGGFVDPAESAEEAAARECREETGWTPSRLSYLASFPNTYEYRSVTYATCDLFYVAAALDLLDADIRVDPAESRGFRWVDPRAFDPAALAFPSARKALAAYLASRKP